ncbi:hypothetical protein KCU67_g9808, partial [Aureobasidium melanogenum]
NFTEVMEDISDRLPPPHLINHNIIKNLVTSLPADEPMSGRKVKAICQRILVEKKPKDEQQQQPHAAAAQSSHAQEAARPATRKKQGRKAHRHHDRPGATHRLPIYDDFGRSFPGQQYPQQMPPLTSYMSQLHLAYDYFGRSFPGQQSSQPMPSPTNYMHQPHIAYDYFGRSVSHIFKVYQASVAFCSTKPRPRPSSDHKLITFAATRRRSPAKT